MDGKYAESGSAWAFSGSRRLPLFDMNQRDGINALEQLSEVIPRTRMILVLERAPEITSIEDSEMPRSLERNLSSARLAAPSTGGAASRILIAPSISPTSAVLEARGCTLTVKVTDPSRSVI